MHYIIMGESRCGKTMLSNLICTNIAGYSKISLDYLVMAFKKVFPELELEYYSGKPNKFYNFVDDYFRNCIHEHTPNINYILEGAKLPYEIVMELNKKKNVTVIYLGKTKISPQEFFNEIRQYEAKLTTGGWTKRLDDEKLLNWCTGWINKSKEYKQFCEENELLFIDTSFNQVEVLNDCLTMIKNEQQITI